MTDDANQYYNAWISVFGPAVKSPCTWHVACSWRKAIKQHMAGVKIRHKYIICYAICCRNWIKNNFGACCMSAFMQHVSTVAPNIFRSILQSCYWVGILLQGCWDPGKHQYVRRVVSQCFKDSIHGAQANRTVWSVFCYEQHGTKRSRGW